MRTDLAAIQSWMQAVIVSDAEIPQEEARQLVLPSKTLTPSERIDIYRGMYIPRMVEALEIDYPAVAHHLGEDGFFNLVSSYVEAYPSKSYTLNRLGDHLPDFLKDKPFLHDLARLEYALNIVFDAEETPPLTTEAIAAVPEDAWENARMKPIAALQLLEFEYRVSEYLTAVLDETPTPSTRKKRTWVAAYRKDYGLGRLDLTRPAFKLLTDLVSGKPLGEAIIAARAKEEHLFTWFQSWMAHGLFQRIY